LGIVLINSVTVIQRVINHSPSRRSLRRTLIFSIFPSKAPSSAESPEKTVSAHVIRAMHLFYFISC